MAVVNHSVVQSTSQETIAEYVQTYNSEEPMLTLRLLPDHLLDNSLSAIPPVVPGNAPAGLAGVQLSANLPHGAQTHHLNAVAHNHPAGQVVPGLLGVAAH
ncbi:hypothetical protein FRC11_008957, partial [Ceratobasidium sp. 423]